MTLKSVELETGVLPRNVVQRRILGRIDMLVGMGNSWQDSEGSGGVRIIDGFCP